MYCENGIIPKTRLYEAYEAFCDATKLRPSPPNTFGKILLKVSAYSFFFCFKNSRLSCFHEFILGSLNP